MANLELHSNLQFEQPMATTDGIQSAFYKHDFMISYLFPGLLLEIDDMQGE